MYRLRRSTTAQGSSSSSNSSNQQPTNSEMRHLTQRIHVLEDAYQEERHQRELLEKKYARLKRRYIRLERAHTKMIIDSHAINNNGGNNVRASSPLLSTPELPSRVASSSPEQQQHSAFERRSPIDRTALASQSTYRSPSYRSPLRAERFSPDADVIDLTSPTSRNSLGRTQETETTSAVSYFSVRSARTTTRPLSDDDLCAESPDSTRGGGDEDTLLRRTGESDRAGRRHLDFLFEQRATASRDMNTQDESDGGGGSTTSFRYTTARPSTATTTRPRPRLGMAESPGRRLRREPEQDRDYDLGRRRRTTSTATTTTSGAATTTPAYSIASAPSSAASSPTTINSSPRSSSGADNDEAASVALAQYLQQQENIAAYQEYEARLRAVARREQEEAASSNQHEFNHHHHSHSHDIARHSAISSAAASAAAHVSLQQREIDPDNMTYDELLQLGEQNGDVKKERWRQMAVQVISCLPTHRWNGSNNSDVSCIICQYSFVHNDRALTLPCAHVFHEECVDGWIRENNSCPLCKLEIAPM